MSDVVAEADVSNGTFYNDFVDRDSLLDALAEQLALSLAAATARAPVPDPARRFALATAADASIDQVEGLVIMTLRRIVVGRARADATERAVERALRALGVGAEEAAAIAAETVDSCAAETADL